MSMSDPSDKKSTRIHTLCTNAELMASGDTPVHSLQDFDLDAAQEGSQVVLPEAWAPDEDNESSDEGCASDHSDTTLRMGQQKSMVAQAAKKKTSLAGTTLTMCSQTTSATLGKLGVCRCAICKRLSQVYAMMTD